MDFKVKEMFYDINKPWLDTQVEKMVISVLCEPADAIYLLKVYSIETVDCR